MVCGTHSLVMHTSSTCAIHASVLTRQNGVWYSLTCPYMHTSSVSYTLQFYDDPSLEGCGIKAQIEGSLGIG